MSTTAICPCPNQPNSTLPIILIGPDTLNYISQFLHVRESFSLLLTCPLISTHLKITHKITRHLNFPANFGCNQKVAGLIRMINKAQQIGVSQSSPSSGNSSFILPNLHALYFKNCVDLTDDDLIPLIKNFGKLHTFTFDYCCSITDKSIEALAQHCCSLLKDLNLSNCLSITDKGLKAIADFCPNLQRLNLSNCLSITCNGLKESIQHCQNLLYLNLSDLFWITDEDLKELVPYWRSLQVLNLTDCSQVTNKGLKAIADLCPNLQVVNLSRRLKITQESPEADAEHKEPTVSPGTGSSNLPHEAHSLQQQPPLMGAPLTSPHITYLFSSPLSNPKSMAAHPLRKVDFEGGLLKIGRSMQLCRRQAKVSIHHITDQSLIAALKRPCTIMHINCQGTQHWLNPQTGKSEPALLLEDKTGHPVGMTHDMLDSLLQSSGSLANMQLLFLSGSHSIGYAEAFIRADIPHVIVIEGEIDEEPVAIFAQHLYQELLSGKPLLDAISRGKTAVTQKFDPSGCQAKKFVTLSRRKDQLEPQCVSLFSSIPLGPWQPSYIEPPYFLPPVTSEFIGRDAEIQTIYQLLTEQPKKCPLVCVCGPEGIGKTEVAKAVGRHVLNRNVYEQGVWFVDLSMLLHLPIGFSLADLVGNTMRLVPLAPAYNRDSDALANKLRQGKIKALIILDGIDLLAHADSSPNHPLCVPTLIKTLRSTCGDLIDILVTCRDPLDCRSEFSSMHSVSIPLDSLPKPIAWSIFASSLQSQGEQNNQRVPSANQAKQTEMVNHAFEKTRGIPRALKEAAYIINDGVNRPWEFDARMRIQESYYRKQQTVAEFYEKQDSSKNNNVNNIPAPINNNNNAMSCDADTSSMAALVAMNRDSFNDITYKQLFLFLGLPCIPQPTKKILQALRTEAGWEQFKADLQQHFCEKTQSFERPLSAADLNAIHWRLTVKCLNLERALGEFYSWWLSLECMVNCIWHLWIKKEPYCIIHGVLSAESASQMLKGKPPGTFLLRISEIYHGGLAIAFVSNVGSIEHCLLVLDKDKRGFVVHGHGEQVGTGQKLEDILLNIQAFTTLYPNVPKSEVFGPNAEF